MKRFLTLFIFTSFLIASGACRKIQDKEMIVIKDCTGSYLQWHGKDYRICNMESVDNYSSGTKVTATFKKIKECHGSANEKFFCAMAHAHEGWVEVIRIN